MKARLKTREELKDLLDEGGCIDGGFIDFDSDWYKEPFEVMPLHKYSGFTEGTYVTEYYSMFSKNALEILEEKPVEIIKEVTKEESTIEKTTTPEIEDDIIGSLFNVMSNFRDKLVKCDFDTEENIFYMKWRDEKGE